jgi:hypothetical protein
MVYHRFCKLAADPLPKRKGSFQLERIRGESYVRYGNISKMREKSLVKL